jgi:hypothetical protein
MKAKPKIKEPRDKPGAFTLILQLWTGVESQPVIKWNKKKFEDGIFK